MAMGFLNFAIRCHYGAEGAQTYPKDPEGAQGKTSQCTTRRHGLDSTPWDDQQRVLLDAIAAREAQTLRLERRHDEH